MSEMQSVYYPQSEIHTTLIPVTTGCPYNRCAFCSMYKADTYGEVPLLEMEHELMKKGHTAAAAVRQGQKLNEAKLPFCAIVMYGIAGEGKGEENARLTAKLLNQFVPAKIITMNLTVFALTELAEMVKEGRFTEATTREKLQELKTLITELHMKKPVEIDTTHTTNLIKMTGRLPEDAEKLLDQIDARLAG